MKNKKVYGLRLRDTDNDPWSEAYYYRKAKNRNDNASILRIIAGIRTYSFEESKTPQEMEEIEFED